MESGPTSVTETIVLPAQPTSGLVDAVPLGGDGFSAPKLAYSIKNFLVTGDASSGNLEQIIRMDQRYCSLVTFATLTIAQGTAADASFRMTITGNRTPGMDDSGLIVSVPSLVDSIEVSHTWFPMALILPGSGDDAILRARVLNVNGDVSRLDAFIYLFDIRVRELTPMGPLLWARGST